MGEDEGREERGQDGEVDVVGGGEGARPGDGGASAGGEDVGGRRRRRSSSRDFGARERAEMREIRRRLVGVELA